MARPYARSQGIQSTFYWRYCTSGKHIDEAADELMKLVRERAGQTLSPYLAARFKSQFRQRIHDAERGRLVPRDECKPIRRDPYLYEIRWTGVEIPVVDAATGLFLEPHRAHFRLYFAEESGARWFLGLHVHEKVVDSEDEAEVYRLQDEEIDRALEVYRRGRAGWGVPELAEV